MGYNETKVTTELDGNGVLIGPTLNTTGRTQQYLARYGSLTTETSPVAIKVKDILSQAGSYAYIQNLTTPAAGYFTLSFSNDGVNYGDEIRIYTTFTLNLTHWESFETMRLTRVSSDSNYGVVAI